MKHKTLMAMHCPEKANMTKCDVYRRCSIRNLHLQTYIPLYMSILVTFEETDRQLNACMHCGVSILTDKISITRYTFIVHWCKAICTKKVISQLHIIMFMNVC